VTDGEKERREGEREARVATSSDVFVAAKLNFCRRKWEEGEELRRKEMNIKNQGSFTRPFHSAV
jgi:hypothetical protein